MTEQQTNYETGELLTVAPQVDPRDQAALFAKVARVMGKLERLPRSGHNDHFNYDFVTDGDVSDAVRAALASENVAFFASMRHTQVDAKKTTAYFTYTFACGKTGATWSCDWVGEAIDSQDKGTAKAATSALKYFLMKNFVLSSGDPADDTDEAKPAPAKRASKPKASATKSSGGNGNKPVVEEPMTMFWATVKELGIDQAVAKSYLSKCDGDAVKAKDMLTKEEAA